MLTQLEDVYAFLCASVWLLSVCTKYFNSLGSSFEIKNK